MYKKKIKLNIGVATLPTILALTILILAVGIGIAVMGLSDSFISAGQKQSSEALIYAEAGARDALVRVARNKNYTAISAYQLNLVAGGCASGDGCATVTVSSGVGSSVDPKIIESEGVVKRNKRKIQVKVYYDTDLNGEIQNAEWREI